MNNLIGTGFYSVGDDKAKRDLAWRWETLISPRPFVVIDNSGLGYPLEHNPFRRVVRIQHNLGHVEQFYGKAGSPQLLGWSMSWIQSALIAYSELRDFLYIEQDCLVFGPWEAALAAHIETNKLAACFGDPVGELGVEQSFFWISWGAILDVIALYLDYPPDAEFLPERKFKRLFHSRRDIGRLPFGVGRNRPFPRDRSPFYIQKITPEEMEDLCPSVKPTVTTVTPDNSDPPASSLT